jgi:hypothetical protein
MYYTPIIAYSKLKVCQSKTFRTLGKRFIVTNIHDEEDLLNESGFPCSNAFPDTEHYFNYMKFLYLNTISFYTFYH